ncbi:MAG: plasmid stabilization protein [Rhodocyclaceae bacterium]|nr:plasmid stabilization protein [Rhodocyclaceae bacterium]
MASLMIRNLDDATKASLRIQAARNGRSMEEEARTILRLAVGRPSSGEGLGSRVHRRFAALGGVDLERPAMDDRPMPDFGTDGEAEAA